MFGDETLFICHLDVRLIKLDQLKRMPSENTGRRLMITHTIYSYWIIQSVSKLLLQVQ